MYDPNVRFGDLRSLHDVLDRSQDAWRPRLGLSLYHSHEPFDLGDKDVRDLLGEFAMLLSVGRGFGYGFSLESLHDYLHGMLIGIQRVSQDSNTTSANPSSFLKDFSWQEGLRLLAMSLALHQNVMHDRSFDSGFWKPTPPDLDRLCGWLSRSQLFTRVVRIDEAKAALFRMASILGAPTDDVERKPNTAMRVTALDVSIEARDDPVSSGSEHLTPSHPKKRPSNEALASSKRQKE